MKYNKEANSVISINLHNGYLIIFLLHRIIVLNKMRYK